jgi:hypothetical protein
MTVGTFDAEGFPDRIEIGFATAGHGNVHDECYGDVTTAIPSNARHGCLCGMQLSSVVSHS